MNLYPYQQKLLEDIYAAWDSGARNIMPVLPTGGGKTVIFSRILRDHNGVSCAIAHRQELLSQISLSLAENGVYHRICSQQSVIREIVKQHVIEYKQSFYDPSAAVVVAGVDTLKNRQKEKWIKQVTLWVCDEGHHLLEKNKWGKVIAFFPHARGAAFTAHPERADGSGLGRAYDGLIDKLVVGPSGRDLIDQGYLSDYIIHTPPMNFHPEDIPISSATGDFNKPKLVAAMREAHIVGSVVDCYLKFAPGLLGVTFATDVEEAQTFTDKFNAAGVPAALITAKTPIKERMDLLRNFRAGRLKQLVNVDIFGEGFDLPALSVVSFARPTASRNLYCQQFGRALRKLKGKSHAIIIDHVGNFARHRFPDTPRAWTLERRERRSRGETEGNPIKMCTNPECFRPYEAHLTHCPYCRHKPIPESRQSIQHVEGDLLELDLATLTEMRNRIDVPFDADRFAGAPMVALRTAMKRHRDKVEAQEHLRTSIAIWGAIQKREGMSKSEAYRKFFLKWKTDVLSAQALEARAALELNELVRGEI